MNWKRLFAVILCSTTLLAFGCNDDDNDIADNGSSANDVDNNDGEDFLGDQPDAGVGDSLSLSQFEQQLTKAMIEHFCQGAFECPERQPSPLIVGVAGRFGDLDTCLENYNPGINSAFLETHRRLIESGTLGYVGRQAAACLDEVRSGLEACGEPTTGFVFEQNDVCSRVFVAQLNDGDECVHNLECSSQNCLAEQDVCGGICGTPIETAEENASCAVAGCDEGLICAFDGSGDLNGLVCLEPGTLQRDELCYGFSDRCVEGLVCGFEGGCTDSPVFVEDGESCNQINRFCDPGLACHGIDPANVLPTGNCGPLRQEGEPCLASDQCRFGLYCDSSESADGICTTQRLEGEPCEGFNNDECTTGLFCNLAEESSVCEMLIVADGACVPPAE